MATVTRDAGLEGFPAMIADLIEANLSSDSRRAKLLSSRTRKVTITASDIDAHAGLLLGGGTVRVSGERLPGSELWISGDSSTLIELPNAKLLGGLPSLADPVGRAVTLKLLKGQLKIKGMFRLALLSRVQRLLSVTR